MKNFAMTAMVVAALSLGACEGMQNKGNKEILGGASGAVIGGVLGSKVGKGSGQLWATGAGVLLGTLAGTEIGRSLDKADMVYAQRASQQAHSAPIGETIRWNNPETGHAGSVTPVRDGYGSGGVYCREYQQKIIVGGQEQMGYGTACQKPDGDWEIVD